jgi:predicted dehydrogenase
MPQYRIGLIGCGWIAHFYARILPSLQERFEVAWVADLEAPRAGEIARQTGGKTLADYRHGLAEVDAVFILLPHHLHQAVAVDCLEAGCHLLLEKPIARTTAEADAIIAAAEKAQRCLMVAYPHRYRTSMRLFRDAVLGGAYGQLFMLDANMDESLQEYALGWMARRETLGGGVFFSASPHMLDVMLWIAGDVQALSMVGTRAGTKMEGEDTAAAIIKFKSGAIGVTRHTWASPRPRIWYTMNATCAKAQVTLTTHPLGDLVSEGPECHWLTRVVALDEQGDERVLHESDQGLDLKPEIIHFLDCLDTGQTPETDGPTARRIVELVQEAYRDADERGANI